MNDLLKRNPSRFDRVASALSLQPVFYREIPVCIDSGPEAVVSPCRSKVEAVASIGPDGRIPEKKRWGRQDYLSLRDLAKQEEAITPFLGGDFINLYLSPWDYHFLIFPTAGRVRAAFFQDGFSWPVVAWGGAILRNAKLVTVIETDFGFPIGLIMVASWMVAGLEPLFEMERRYRRAERFGRFRIGSTVLLLFPPGRMEILCRPGQKLELGECLARASNS